MGKLAKHGGRPAKLTPELVDSVASELMQGLPITYALRQVNMGFTPQHWEQSLRKAPLLLARFEKRLGDLMKGHMGTIVGATRQNLPVGTCWMLERLFPHHFAQQKAGPSSITVNNVCIGLADDISKRAAALVLASAKRAKAIEVQATVQMIEDKPSP